MLEIVKKHIEQLRLLDPNKPVLVALSGGRDSVALLSVLRNLSYEVIALHCNFRLRNQESDRDELFVRQLCNHLDVPLTIRHFDTVSYSRTKGISVEMAARELRYQWFENMRLRLKAQAVAVAHHQDDQAETLLLNITRGTGLRGMCGMKSKNGYIVRPLLCVGRQQIEQYISDNHLQYVDDSTNKDTAYKRNNIRHNIIPQLQTINPNIIQTLNQETVIFQNTCLLLDYFVKQQKELICTNTDNCLTINLDKLKLHPMAQELLYEFIRDYGFNGSQAQLIFSNLDSQSGKRYFSADYQLIKDRNEIIVYLKDKQIIEPQLEIKQRPKAVKEKFPSAKADTAFFDSKVLSRNLTLRHWQEGDTFHPLGMNGSRKLSDFFTDMKVSLKRKHELWLLMSGDDIAWIVGERIDNRFKVTKQTTEVVEITIK